LGAPLTETAPAKINLSLRVLGRRTDGYHLLESLVVFADLADTLTLEPGGETALATGGPFAEASGPLDNNLVLKAVAALRARVPGLKAGRFVLTKNVPVAAGLGGGSADAGATLRLLARANGLSRDDSRLYEAARSTGADVPVCLDPQTRVMRGIGEVLSKPLALPPLAAVLVNPGVAVATKAVFAEWTGVAAPAAALGLAPLDKPTSREQLLEFLATRSNDLEAPAIALAPVIAEVLAALRAVADCRLARMSGSGATCFALLGSAASAQRAAELLRRRHPRWWVRAGTLAGE